MLRVEAASPRPPFEGDTPSFVKRAKKPTPAELGSLARAIVGPKSADTLRRLEALAPWCEDPRVSVALEALVRDVPYTSDGARPVFTQAFAMLTRIADPAFLELAPSLPGCWKFRAAQRDWLAQQLERCVQAIRARRTSAPVRALDAKEKKALAVLAVPAPANKATAPRTEGSLLAAITAQPREDAPRLVYADFLLEQGDPRGEFITLQFKPDKTKQELTREAALVAKHGKAWLGPLAACVNKEVEFRRGFVTKVVARFKNEGEVEKFARLPEWATIEDLSFSGKSVEALPTHARPRSLVVSQKGLEGLLAAKTPWTSLESLTLSTTEVDTMKSLAASSLFPNVGVLRVNDGFEPELLATGWLKKVADPGVLTHNPPTEKWLPAAERLGLKRFTIVHTSGGAEAVTFVFERGPDQRLSKLQVRVGDAQPGTLRFLASRFADGAFVEVHVDGAPKAIAAAFEAKRRPR